MPLQKCHGCGVEKDPGILEVYSHPETEILCTDPIPPLMVLEVQGYDEHEGKWKAVVVCHECFHKLDPDMWISSRCLQGINAITPFDQLPNMRYDLESPERWRAETYAPQSPQEG